MLLKRGIHGNIFKVPSKYFSTIVGANNGKDFKDININNSKLFRELSHIIKFSGPITLARYMQEVLTNPCSGYYQKPHFLGKDGDFVTSPEISPLFGECIALWLFNEWYKMGENSSFQLVEFGPGKGTLMADILRTLSVLFLKKNNSLSANLSSIHFIDLHEYASTNEELKNYEIQMQSSLSDVPKQFSFYIAHEFFDALPIHKFARTEKGWREILIDLHSNENEFRFIQSKHPTPANSYINLDKYNHIHHQHDFLEICPSAGVIVNEMSDRIDKYGGCGLIIDYGPTNHDSFRSFYRHKQIHPLTATGTADLTADVDFDYLISQVSPFTKVYGPVTQASFLKALGIQIRCEKILQNSKGQINSKIKSGVERLLNDFGERFKFMSIFPKTMNEIHKLNPPLGF